MKLCFLSDLHFESGYNIIFDENSFDVLILAGDIFVYSNDYSKKKFIEFVSSLKKEILFVSGNHEYYDSDFKTVNNYLKCLEKQYKNFHYLNNEYYDFNGVRFLGSTLWSDFGFCYCISEHIYYEKINDFKKIFFNENNHFRINHCVSFAYEAKEFIKNNLSTHLKNVVITHFPPSQKSFSEENKVKFQDVNAYFACNCYDIINDNIYLWIHGHCHNSSSYYLGKTLVISNPRGYLINDDYYMYENEKFKENMIIEIC